MLFRFPFAQNLPGVTAWFKWIADVPEDSYEIKCKCGRFSARIFQAPVPYAHNSWYNTKTTASATLSTTVSASKRLPLVSKPSKTESARRVGLLFAPPWRVADDFWRKTFTDNTNIVATIDTRTESLNVVDKKCGVLFQHLHLLPLVVNTFSGCASNLAGTLEGLARMVSGHARKTS